VAGIKAQQYKVWKISLVWCFFSQANFLVFLTKKKLEILDFCIVNLTTSKFSWEKIANFDVTKLKEKFPVAHMKKLKLKFYSQVTGILSLFLKSPS